MSGLLEGGAGRRLRLTVRGEQFLASEPPIQAWFLLETWWHHTDWLIACRFVGMGEWLPYEFTLSTLGHLIELPVERSVPFEDFADRLIRQTGLKWKARDMTHARDLLHGSVERMVIDILVDFRAVVREEKGAGVNAALWGICPIKSPIVLTNRISFAIIRTGVRNG